MKKVSVSVPAKNGVGSACDISLLASVKKLTVDKHFNGVLAVEVSPDGQHYFELCSIPGVAQSKSLDVLATHLRLRLENHHHGGLPSVHIEAAEAEKKPLCVRLGVLAKGGDGAKSNVENLGAVKHLFVAHKGAHGVMYLQNSDDGENFQPSGVPALVVECIKKFKGTSNWLRVSRSPVPNHDSILSNVPGVWVVAEDVSPAVDTPKESD